MQLLNFSYRVLHGASEIRRTTEQLFQVLRWLVKTGGNYRAQVRYGRQGVMELLNCQPSLTGMATLNPIVSLFDLHRRFQFAVLGKGHPIIEQWRQEYGINVYGTKIIPFPSYERTFGDQLPSEKVIKQKVNDLLGSNGNLNISLNSCHPRARFIKQVKIGVGEAGFQMILQYGFARDTSYWDYTLARTENNEPFLDTFLRAEKRLAEIKTKN